VFSFGEGGIDSNFRNRIALGKYGRNLLGQPVLQSVLGIPILNIEIPIGDNFRMTIEINDLGADLSLVSAIAQIRKYRLANSAIAAQFIAEVDPVQEVCILELKAAPSFGVPLLNTTLSLNPFDYEWDLLLSSEEGWRQHWLRGRARAVPFVSQRITP
jgi:hypothetical protein